jgi:predicted nucleic acid-binding protein
MGSQSCLSDPGSLVVIDTSAAINLISTGCAARILQALPNRVLAVDVILVELEEGRRRGRPDANLMNELVMATRVEIVALGNPAEAIFEELVIGAAAMTLDDGEAATIAYAVEHGAIAIIDERKANRICGAKFAKLRLGSTVDLFAHPAVMDALGRESLSKAVVSALRLARMRVLPHHVEWVIGLIGPEQARICRSLPQGARLTPRPSLAIKG